MLISQYLQSLEFNFYISMNNIEIFHCSWKHLDFTFNQKLIAEVQAKYDINYQGSEKPVIDNKKLMIEHHPAFTEGLTMYDDI